MTIDYRSIPEVQGVLNELESMRRSEDDLIARLGRTFLQSNGDEIWLRIKITDPEVAQSVLLSLVYKPLSFNLPGMELFETSLPGAREEKAVKEWLRERLRELS